MDDSPTRLRVYTYIDGFNLYYGSLSGSPYKWLNLEKLMSLLCPEHDILKIKYYTARVKAFPFDLEAPKRQDSYLRALKTLETVEIIEGTFQSRQAPVRLVSDPSKEVLAYKTTEKGSDVNLATDFVNDAHLDRFDLGIVVSNDSDLVNALRIVRRDAKKKVWVVRTSQDDRGREMGQYARRQISIETKHLQVAQFPTQINRKGKSPIIKPHGW